MGERQVASDGAEAEAEALQSLHGERIGALEGRRPERAVLRGRCAAQSGVDVVEGRPGDAPLDRNPAIAFATALADARFHHVARRQADMAAFRLADLMMAVHPPKQSPPEAAGR